MSFRIASVLGREVLDSRGNPTVEVELGLSSGAMGMAMVPSGASKGEHEARELRDEDPKRFLGKGTLRAATHINDTLRRILTGKTFTSLEELDNLLIRTDGSAQKSNLGANALLGVSLAFAHAVAAERKLPLYLIFNEAMGNGTSAMQLPIPLMNVLNGGEHANNPLEMQEIMIVPHGFETFSEALRAGCEIFQGLKKTLDSKGHSTAVGDEGGFAPNLESNEQAMELLCEAIRNSGYQLKSQISLALDVASSSFYDKATGKYEIGWEGEKQLTTDKMLNYYDHLFRKFPIVSVEDGLDENDWKGWQALTQKFGKKVQLVGDDLFVTNKTFVQKGIELEVANAVLIKVNQIGTLTETLQTMRLANEYRYRCIVSHRSGETEDTTISHLAVGTGCGQIKTGSLSRSERTAKYNELLRIEERAKRAGTPIKFAKVF